MSSEKPDNDLHDEMMRGIGEHVDGLITKRLLIYDEAMA